MTNSAPDEKLLSTEHDMLLPKGEIPKHIDLPPTLDTILNNRKKGFNWNLLTLFIFATLIGAALAFYHSKKST